MIEFMVYVLTTVILPVVITIIVYTLVIFWFDYRRVRETVEYLLKRQNVEDKEKENTHGKTKE